MEQTIIKILFVCTGNTCRSPLAHAFLLNKIEALNIKCIEVDSAGIGCAEGMDISENSQAVLKERNINFTHKSRAITMKDIEDFTFIICMTKSHYNLLKNYALEEKLYTLDEITGCGDIIDPYGQDLDVYRKTAQQLDDAIDKLLIQITKKYGL